jgi:hypothetical protein
MKRWVIMLMLGPLFPIPGAALEVSKPQNPAPAAVTETGSLINTQPPGYIYYTLKGGIDLITPWSAAIAATGWDFIGKETIAQGYLPLVRWWKITGVFGGGINGKGEGSPMGGGILTLAEASLGPNANFNLALTGGYNINAGHALAVVSGSIWFLK